MSDDKPHGYAFGIGAAIANYSINKSPNTIVQTLALMSQLRLNQ